jgi:hypothetical protein
MKLKAQSKLTAGSLLILLLALSFSSCSNKLKKEKARELIKIAGVVDGRKLPFMLTAGIPTKVYKTNDLLNALKNDGLISIQQHSVAHTQEQHVNVNHGGWGPYGFSGGGNVSWNNTRYSSYYTISLTARGRSSEADTRMEQVEGFDLSEYTPEETDNLIKVKLCEVDLGDVKELVPGDGENKTNEPVTLVYKKVSPFMATVAKYGKPLYGKSDIREGGVAEEKTVVFTKIDGNWTIER